MTPNEPAAHAPAPAASSHHRPDRRVTWVAGSRGDLLLLGPLFQHFKKRLTPGLHHWLLDSGEAGMAAIQARDWLRLVPDEAGDLCHPADEPAIRLSLMIERTESFIRRHKGSHVVFSGWGPTAAATAIYCHARGCRGLWLRPPDPAGLVARLRWEAGLERIIRACVPCVQLWQVPAAPDWGRLIQPGAARPLTVEIPGLRPAAPLVLIAVLRRDWGTLDDATSRLARAAAAWAHARPESDFLILSNLNARLEAPVRSLAGRPDNLILAPPLPYPVYHEALRQARLLLTDSPLIAAEALARRVPTATFGDLPAPPASGGEQAAHPPSRHRPLLPEDLAGASWAAELAAWLDAPPPVSSAEPAPAGDLAGDPVFSSIHGALEQWLA